MFGDRQRPMVLVLGLGESGLAIARWCARHGCRLRIADTREAPPHLAALQAEGIDAEFVGGAFTPALLDGGVEIVGLSPGLSPLEPALAALLAAAHERGVAVWGELEFFAQALRALGTSGYQPKVIAITGTNGKTTTTSLTGRLCQRSGKKVAVAGNISPAMLDRLASAIDDTALPDVWVLELSSFQLETARTFAPDAAAILNITQDHLDWHGSFDAYAQAKGRIFGATTTRVLNRDDAAVMKFAPAAGAADAPRTVTFGLNEPTQDGDYGLSRDNGIAWLVEAVDRDAPDEATTTRRRKRDAAHTPDIAQKRLMPADALRIRGLHNAANALAAFALARAIDLPAAPLLHALREYRGEAHRVEVIATIDDVDYVDDSKGTNVGATVAALDGLAQKIVLIAGGDGKGQDFAPLVAPVARWCRAVMLIGRDAPAIRDTLAETGVPLVDHATLEGAVHAAADLAEPGDAVLLSPACASLDMFRNYAHRAEVFRAAVDEIAIDKGATP
ncbi:UDP-N-acetylmuramoyl-L-alanine--D-glutamate ligase [Burkholderia cenocepacia]|uniref:UDP-N-acetylmuramoyl-L-alanine--D-glutamate ligase n=1 Tax=Burkholderia cenocepacia TaxID=95486 RepID=UPI00097C4888|nr:UDP-N-acetylmuramoyl-L-alanine--D-glutamate ligase [Burkholderia cenocepacia]AQQ48603.1 UDP-N-acetylmuramoyl-L-alanine--D-glutamate ligase [Burkholderia cenocepacia]MBR8261013.1 UDP-N-acetylmuramoyl-L-alanine--D-glutamate ligase [Burkholderia cenocepacia]ONI93430.1 UDP-N-acetylmuramoyl-L-alanine--D-glutamate ligase [Burkholderia cenocepacia]ONJ09691.1 UDP-N-acetylmuramoyl-L-alanine--D-glutamate ligase [Burkholderia cenocepacia]ONJ28485.1 UDP-N-acetylmuramoyl-L-alanine--D-glutamate ligase [B